MPNLDAYQTAAVATSENRVLVTAVPGSGKTTTLVARILHMLEQGLEPRTIVCVTFTRHAAAQLRERVGEAGKRVVIGTLHSFCLRMIREMGQSIGYEWEWLTIEDDDDAILEQYDALTDLGIMTIGPDGRRIWRQCKAKEWAHFTTQVQAGLLDPDDDDNPDVLRLAWNAYMDRLRSQNTLTYGTILTEAYRLLRNKKALAIFRRRYRHFLIDEAQDTSHLQWSIVFRLVEKAQPDTLFVVGDLDQSIYEWRGAAPRDMLKMAKSDKTTCYTLPTTYRFGPGIAAPAQRLIDHNVQRLPTKIKTVRDGGAVNIYREPEKLAFIATRIKQEAATYGHKGVAVLSRRHAPLKEMEKILTAQGTPCRRIGKQSDLRHSIEFRILMAYIRCAANPRDRRAFARIATLEGITAEQMREFRMEASSGTPIASLWFTDDNPAPWEPEDLEKRVTERDKERDYAPAVGLLREAMLFQALQSAADIERWFAMADIQDEIAQTAAEDSVTLCTVHAAKGLEWPCVFVVDLCENTWPSGGSIRDGREEEERRLLYVAATRAQKHLIMAPTICEGELRIMAPSRFIEECT